MKLHTRNGGQRVDTAQAPAHAPHPHARRAPWAVRLLALLAVVLLALTPFVATALALWLESRY